MPWCCSTSGFWEYLFEKWDAFHVCPMWQWELTLHIDEVPLLIKKGGNDFLFFDYFPCRTDFRKSQTPLQ